MLPFRKKFWQLSYGYKDRIESSSHEHRLPEKKSIKTLQFKNGNFYNSYLVHYITNDIFHVYEKIAYNFYMGLIAKSSS